MSGSKQTGGADSAGIVIIRPSRGWMPVNLGDVWRYHELLYFLTWRTIKVRYKQTALGFAWALIQPFTMMVVFTLFFGNLAKIPSDGIPYPLFSFAALLPWTLFAEGTIRSSQSLVADANLVKKVYFPRLVMPLAGVLSPVVDFAIAFVILMGMMLYYGHPLTVNVLWLPVFVMLAMMTSLGVGLWLSAINVKYRDIRYVVPFLIQLWLFASPVVYSANLLPEQFRAVYGLNPMAGVIEGFRWALLGTAPPSSLIVLSSAMVTAILVSGAFYFRRNERGFADVL